MKKNIEINCVRYNIDLPRRIISNFEHIDDELSVCNDDLVDILDYVVHLKEMYDKAFFISKEYAKKIKDLKKEDDYE